MTNFFFTNVVLFLHFILKLNNQPHKNSSFFCDEQDFNDLY